MLTRQLFDHLSHRLFLFLNAHALLVQILRQSDLRHVRLEVAHEEGWLPDQYSRKLLPIINLLHIYAWEVLALFRPNFMQLIRLLQVVGNQLREGYFTLFWRRHKLNKYIVLRILFYDAN